MPFQNIFQSYSKTFKGFSAEVWWLALITLINRAGTMVIPFLSLYLKDGKGFSLEDVGWVMSAYGAGSVVGSFIGGYLNDKIGAYKTIAFSLFSSGVLFILTQYADSFFSIIAMVFLVILCADIFRPALFVALKTYSTPENQTRSVTLIRLAINLGFSFGPAIGGFLIFSWGYTSLFWVDGVTCIAAMILFLIVLNPRRSMAKQSTETTGNLSAYSDKLYLLFCLGMLLFGLAFLQYFSTVPVYYKDVYHLSEEYIGLLMGFNGFLIFLIEMPLIFWLEKKPGSSSVFIVFGFFLSFLVYNIGHHVGWLWAGIVLMTFAEMLVFPFSNNFAMERSKRGNMGQYMGLYSISFSIAHIVGHTSGMQITDNLGFSSNWYIMATLCVMGMLIFVLIARVSKRNK